jgi:RNA polymerase sigma factor (sigma-70 family)
MTVRADPLTGYIRRLASQGEASNVTDEALLARFIDSRDDEAFAGLVARHGPMVLGVCRRVLGNIPDAEDAFQATFLALARQARRIRPADRLGGYLHTVAWRIAGKARASLRRRRRNLRLLFGTSVPDRHADPLADMSAREMLTIIDHELQRLPEVERVALALCCLEGLSQQEAAQRLGWTPDSVRGRLQRGRQRLAVRLARRGLTLPAVLLAIKIANGVADGAVPVALATRTARAAAVYHMGDSGATAVVMALARHGLRTIALTRLKLAATFFLTAVLVLGGIATGLLSTWPAPLQEMEPPHADDQPGSRTAPVSMDLLGDPLPEGALLRIGTTRMRAQHYVNAIVFSNDHRLMGYGTEFGFIHVCEAATGKPCFELKPEPDRYNRITELAFSPDGKTLAAGGYWCKDVYLIDVATPESIE